MRTAKTDRRCAHPGCGDTIPAGEPYEVIEREPYHLECALVVTTERTTA